MGSTTRGVRTKSVDWLQVVLVMLAATSIVALFIVDLFG
jgi:hypothetical protein